MPTDDSTDLLRGAALLGDARVWDSATGAFISSKHQRMAQVLHDYKPTLSVLWIPPKDRSERDQFPFAILDSSPNKAPHIIRKMTEDQMDHPEEILAWVFEGDMAKHRPVDILQRIQLKEMASELLAAKAEEDARAEATDQLAFAVDRLNHGQSFSMNGQRFREDGRRVRKGVTL